MHSATIPFGPNLFPDLMKPVIPDVDTVPQISDVKVPDTNQDIPQNKIKAGSKTEDGILVPTPHLLHELSSVDRLFITKRLRVKTVLFLRGKKNRFYIRTPEKELVYTVEEENSWWVGYFLYGLRPLQLRVTDGEGAEVMRITRPYACTARVLPCQLQRIEVFAPPGCSIGTIEQQWTAIRPLYLVKDSDGFHLFWIRGPYMTLSLFKDVQFDITRPDGTTIGGTCKRWQGLTHALFLAPVTDRFGVAFDKDLTVEQKALLLAATLLMDYMYYDV
ncbi:phospholipid scramblase family member 5-like [Achroia grisella]|uniref:phospholipid scramblase family member 5-like n=1 Tax=Achroia grisella TaxID=688607 RepID=UPI0027D2AE48|nr:phospholipid scramblase family member 5-like [Achroia grisella]